MIKIKKLVKNYTTGTVVTKVLRGIDLEIKKGEFLAIMGKSGAGKSTLMYQISLLDTPTSGEIIIDGIDVSTLDEKQRTQFRLEKLGYVFQDYALLPELSAIENVVIPLLMEGLSKKDALEKAKNALESVGLGHRLDNRPSQLSGGEQQRVSIARAIAQNPDILFADEPTANLDSVSSEEIMKVIGKLHKEYGQTVVMVTHEKEYAKNADRIISVSDGQIINEEILN